VDTGPLTCGSDHLAKVGVAGSNPVVRSRSEGASVQVGRPQVTLGSQLRSGTPFEANQGW
jgi:hypothetical protein